MPVNVRSICIKVDGKKGRGGGGGVKGLREEEDGRSLGRGTAEGKMRRWEIGDQGGSPDFK